MSDTLVKLLRGGTQADEDGIIVKMSRQACLEAADLIEQQAVRIAALKEEIDLMLKEIGELYDTQVMSKEKNAEEGMRRKQLGLTGYAAHLLKSAAIMEIKPMTEENMLLVYTLLEAATKSLAVKAGTADANDALKYSQAALNLAHVLATLNYMK